MVETDNFQREKSIGQSSQPIFSNSVQEIYTAIFWIWSCAYTDRNQAAPDEEECVTFSDNRCVLFQEHAGGRGRHSPVPQVSGHHHGFGQLRPSPQGWLSAAHWPRAGAQSRRLLFVAGASEQESVRWPLPRPGRRPRWRRGCGGAAQVAHGWKMAAFCVELEYSYTSAQLHWRKVEAHHHAPWTRSPRCGTASAAPSTTAAANGPGATGDAYQNQDRTVIIHNRIPSLVISS